MESALTWTSTNANYPPITILICTDSKLLRKALLSLNPRIFSIHESINSISSTFTSNEFQDILTIQATN